MELEAEERGWQELRARWPDEAAHRAWLAAFTDLEGLARAGQRYRAHLAEHPDDAVAQRWIAEVVKRATVHGLASLPRTKPAPTVPRWARRAIIALLGALLAWVLHWVAQQASSLASGR